MTAADTSPAESPELVAAEARRRRAFRWAMSAPLIWLLMLLAVRLVWGYIADHRLQAEIDRIRAAGEPLFAEDFPPPPDIPDEANAAVLYKQAAEAMVRVNGTTISFEDFVSDLRFASAYPEDARVVVKANAMALALLRQGRDLNAVNWGVRFSSPILETDTPDLAVQRQLAVMGVSSAIALCQDGDQSEAIETLRDVLTFACRLGDNQTTFVSTWGLSAGLGISVSWGIETVSPALQTRESSFGSSSLLNPVEKQQVMDLISQLLDEEPARRNLRFAILTERAAGLDGFDQFLFSGRLKRAATGIPARSYRGIEATPIVLRPSFELDSARFLRQSTTLLESSRASNFGKAREISAPFRIARPCNYLESTARLVSAFVARPSDWILAVHFRGLAHQRMAALALAIRLYELDHGRRPEELVALVPNYLEALPQDPFASDGRTFGYKPVGSPPILCSVGEDSRDDAGQYVVDSFGVAVERKDLPFFLDGNRPRPPLELHEKGS
jgi:hypothetical protein